MPLAIPRGGPLIEPRGRKSVAANSSSAAARMASRRSVAPGGAGCVGVRGCPDACCWLCWKALIGCYD